LSFARSARLGERERDVARDAEGLEGQRDAGRGVRRAGPMP
jgi:hypothetical protein